MTIAAATLAMMVLGCTGERSQVCTGKCDDSGEGWKTNLDGRADPIAAFLRGFDIDDRGEAALDLGVVLQGLAAQQGCDQSSIRTFIVSDDLVSESGSFPRLISTVCTDDNAKAPQFFLAASLQEEGSDDVDVRTLEMFAWDDDARIYRFYETEIVDDQKVSITVDPERCRQCHLAPRDLSQGTMPMLPIMNELTAPWVHWSAEPDFPSHTYVVPDVTETAPNFVAFGKNHLGAAPRLEEIIRAGHALVSNARVRDRRTRPADLDTAMSLLRPVFCAEQINYATEDFSSGLITASVAISGGLREAYLALSATEWPWNWLTDGRMRLATGSAPLFMMPVRGNADIDYESRLVSVNVLTAHQVLRVRALDWKRPVFSSFRCGLWKQAMERLSNAPPVIEDSWRVADLMRHLYDEIMQLDGLPLACATPEQVIAVDSAGPETETSLFVALDEGTLPVTCGSGGAGMCALSIHQLGDLLDAYIKDLEQRGDGRAALTTLRDQSLCHVEEVIESLPALPEVTCP